MKKILLNTVMTLFLLANLSVIAKEKDDFTLKCSYITAKTNFHITLKPIKFTKSGDAYMDGKYAGKAYKTDDGTLYLPMEKGALFSLDFNKWLSIYSILIDEKPVYNFGSCEIISAK